MAGGSSSEQETRVFKIFERLRATDRGSSSRSGFLPSRIRVRQISGVIYRSVSSVSFERAALLCRGWLQRPFRSVSGELEECGQS